MTSGFTSAINRYTLSLVEKLRYFLRRCASEVLVKEGYLDPANTNGRSRDV